MTSTTPTHSTTEHDAALPVLDLREFDPGTDPAVRSRFLERLRETCHDVGFFYLVGHGIGDTLFREVEEVTRAFFALPEADRMAIAMTRSPHFRGYTPLGGELTNGRADRREEIDLGEATIKAIHYPPSGPGCDHQGVGTHRDFGLLTFVLQDAVGGLQVERDGCFFDVPHLPGALVVNLGEMLQLATHGYLKATVHRVISPPAGVRRFSVIYFFNPRLDATLTPIDLPAELAAQATGGHSADPDNPILATYGENILKVRLRAHADVAQLHHADLLAAES
ncbi:hypothetical protein CcI156_12905 [Frankia sp. CcI156]|jgi:isopenicillin N synthase-like dioxygenase|nr:MULTISPECIES: 2-oxoglutarate and iron-dependent oxygenase domain-containing protein [Frankia]ETA01549.1 hypothetical protein CcI6DRAFT_03024 [Frankia sp. CcI6]EYT91921.1 hypothetical protein ThrDRAFT_02440 [Frankia casuarinae]KDA42652.1 hypothetical protein BMG523Draft_02492 [Frankia sp. BMG5.23]KEZ35553.1 2OG-Fe(II) oxygenase superfamily enzyme [Frankia sp. CeD]OAA22959.1 2OG-Fe(II) oxygenase superfamily enzyme [Frankia casuarinae]